MNKLKFALYVGTQDMKFRRNRSNNKVSPVEGQGAVELVARFSREGDMWKFIEVLFGNKLEKSNDPNLTVVGIYNADTIAYCKSKVSNYHPLTVVQTKPGFWEIG